MLKSAEKTFFLLLNPESVILSMLAVTARTKAAKSRKANNTVIGSKTLEHNLGPWILLYLNLNAYDFSNYASKFLQSFLFGTFEAIFFYLVKNKNLESSHVFILYCFLPLAMGCVVYLITMYLYRTVF